MRVVSPSVRFAVAVLPLLLSGVVDAQQGRALGPTGPGSATAPASYVEPGALDLTSTAEQEHEALFLEDRFPSATTCATCHPSHFREWSVSPHAYAQLSPVFNAMQGTILKQTNGTNGDFCIRCHTPVGMNLGEPELISNLDRHPTSREGITCIVCHRVNRSYGKLSGRLAIEEGSLFAPVYGPQGGAELERVIASSEYRVNTDPNEAGRNIHTRAETFFQLTTSGFCGTCHDVNLVNGFRLEEAFSEFKTAPAAKRGESCQDCHMGLLPGVVSGYREEPAAIVGDRPTRPRKRTDHMFVGPDYSIVHPGIFPHNTAASELASLREWLQFDVAAGWGTDAFESEVAETDGFPERWRSADDRYDARDLIEANLALLSEASEKRLVLLREGYVLGEPIVLRADGRGLAFEVDVRNGTDGHGVPTGFDAERLVFLRVTVRDADGVVVFRSGDFDPNGDVRDGHSVYVHNGDLPLDRQLFSLQSRFVTRMVRGGEREQVLAVNYSPDPLPFLRPSTESTILTGRPAGARKHKQNIEPNGKRVARYRVSSAALTGKWPYQATIELVAGMVPVNLVHEIQGVGFDYFMSPREVAERVVDGHQVLARRELVLSDLGSGGL
jgi:hypothetical protein